MIESPRFDLLVARHGRTLLVVAIAVGVLSVVAAGYVLATPSTTQTTEEVDRETVSTDVTTSAVVVDGERWEEGTELEDNAVYLLEDTPELTLEVVTTVPNDGTDVVHEVLVDYRATLEGETFWEESDSVARTSASVEGDRATSTTTIDVEAVDEEYRNVESDFDDVGSVEVALVVVTEYDTGTYDDAIRSESPLEITANSYRLADADALSEGREHGTTETVEVTESPNLGLVGVLSTIAALSVGVGAFVATRSDVDEEEARLAVHRQRYADWISNGSLPMWMGDHHVFLDTLEDVVDVAIDTNERVVHDDQRGLFAVVNDGVVYYYSDRGLWEETAWPDMSFTARDSDGDAVEDVPSIEAGDELEWSGGDDSDDPDFSDDEDVWRQL